HAVAFSPDGRLLAVGEADNEDSKVRLLELATGKDAGTLSLPKGRIPSRLVFSPDGSLLAAADLAEVRVWPVHQRKRFRLYQGHENAVTDVAFSSDSKRLASTSQDLSLRVWEIDSEEEVGRLTAENTGFSSVVFCGKAAAGGTNHDVRIWDAAAAEKV